LTVTQYPLVTQVDEHSRQLHITTAEAAISSNHQPEDEHKRDKNKDAT